MRARRPAALLAALALAGSAPAARAMPSLLHPARRALAPPPQDLRPQTVRFSGTDGAPLEGWLFRAPAGAPHKGLLVYLHGIGDNRLPGVGVARRFVAQGWDVFAYDQRAHGRSGGAACTFGVLERRDVGRALDALGATNAVVFGSSMGAAVALQAAAVDPRIVAVVAQSPFDSLRTVAHERAPHTPPEVVDASLAKAAQEGGFRVDDASPLALAPQIKVPVLLVHGTDDVEVPADDSRRLDRALTCPHRLVLVAGAGHNDVLAREESWTAIARFLEQLAPPAQGRAAAQPKR